MTCSKKRSLCDKDLVFARCDRFQFAAGGYKKHKDVSENHLVVKRRIEKYNLAQIFEIKFIKEDVALVLEVYPSAWTYIYCFFPLFFVFIFFVFSAGQTVNSALVYFIFGIGGVVIFLFLMFLCAKIGADKIKKDIELKLKQKSIAYKLKTAR